MRKSGILVNRRQEKILAEKDLFEIGDLNGRGNEPGIGPAGAPDPSRQFFATVTTIV